jgi:hypothetical protein
MSEAQLKPPDTKHLETVNDGWTQTTGPGFPTKSWTCRERSEFLRLEISNFNTHSNLIALGEYRGLQLKPDYHSSVDAAWCCFRLRLWLKGG